MATHDYEGTNIIGYDNTYQQPSGVQSQDLGHDLNFILNSMKSFVVYLYHHIWEKNVYKIH